LTFLRLTVYCLQIWPWTGRRAAPIIIAPSQALYYRWAAFNDVNPGMATGLTKLFISSHNQISIYSANPNLPNGRRSGRLSTEVIILDLATAPIFAKNATSAIAGIMIKNGIISAGAVSINDISISSRDRIPASNHPDIVVIVSLLLTLPEK